jgi:hypothetical protein
VAFVLLLAVLGVHLTLQSRADGTTPDTELIGKNIQEQIYNYLTKPGRLKPFQAAAVMGNIQHESGMQPMRLQGTASGVVTPAETVGSRNIGWGLVQWTPASKFIDTQNPKSNANSVLVQMNFLWAQLSGLGPLPEKRAGDELKGTPNLEEAVIAFQGNTRGAPSPMGKHYYGFERPADQTGSVAARTNHARQFLSQFGNTTPSPTPTPGPVSPYACTAPFPTIRQGDSGSCVQHLAWHLNRIAGDRALSETGSFDAMLDQRVRAFQSGKNLTVDGIVGPLTWGEIVAAPTADPPVAAKPADLNGDGRVNIGDLSILLSSWGTARADLDADSTTSISDLSRLLSAWTG